MIKETKEELKKEIARIVKDHSGGLKMMELIPELVSTIFTQPKYKDERILTKELIQEIENLINEIPNIFILEYDYDMSGTMRAKEFVYFKKTK